VSKTEESSTPCQLLIKSQNSVGKRIEAPQPVRQEEVPDLGVEKWVSFI